MFWYPFQDRQRKTQKGQMGTTISSGDPPEVMVTISYSDLAAAMKVVRSFIKASIKYHHWFDGYFCRECKEFGKMRKTKPIHKPVCLVLKAEALAEMYSEPAKGGG